MAKKIKLFVASSGTLKEEREAIERFLARKNDILVNSDIYLELIIWEKTSRKFSPERKQNEFNELIYNSDIFICLVFDKVGEFTLEEFNKAYQSFNNKQRPYHILVYFKNSPISSKEINEGILGVLNLKEQIKKVEQIYNDFDSTSDLLLSIDQEINFVLSNKEIESIIENSWYDVKLSHSIITLIEPDGSFAKLRKFQHLKVVSEFDTIYDSILVDGQVDINSIKIDIGISHKINKTLGDVKVETSMGRTYKIGEEFTKTLTCDLYNSFTQSTEFWEQDNVGALCHLTKTTIVFPEQRKYKKIYSKIIRGFQEIELPTPKEIIFEDGRFAIDLENLNEKQYDKIRTYWEW